MVMPVFSVSSQLFYDSLYSSVPWRRAETTLPMEVSGELAERPLSLLVFDSESTGLDPQRQLTA